LSVERDVKPLYRHLGILKIFFFDSFSLDLKVLTIYRFINITLKALLLKPNFRYFKVPLTMTFRAIRGATQVSMNSRSAIGDGVRELLPAMLSANGLTVEGVISVLMTSTPDLTADFPAASARDVGFAGTPLICAVEIDVPDSLERVIRVLMHVEIELEKSQISHIYLHGATALRKDLAQ
jgi:chorismate mutase